MEEVYKEVMFDIYCGLCVYKDLKEDDYPCYDCLAAPGNLYSHRPIGWKGEKDD